MPSNKSVLLSTYINTVNDETYALFGPIENITGYLCRKFSDVYMISQPMSGEAELTPVLTYYKGGKVVWIKRMPKFLRMFYWVDPQKVTSNQTVVRLKVRDFISNIYFILFVVPGKLDLFIGVESINALSAILLRMLGRLHTLLYFSNDYHPHRYTWFKNSIFLKLDEIAACHGDYIWMMNPNIHESRLERGLDARRLAPHHIIHGGLPFFPGAPVPLVERKKNRIVYATRAGHQGLQIMLEALSVVAGKYPDTTLYITGHADREKPQILPLMQKLKISENVVFTGFLKEAELNDLVKCSWIGVAIWSCDSPASATYGDPEKIRRYFHFGLPVVSTPNAFTAETIKKHGAGIVADDEAKAVAAAICRLFSDDSLYAKCAQVSEGLGAFYKEHNTLDDSFDDLQKRQLL